MKNFTKGILLGVGVGLLVAPLSGQETRRLLAERVQSWRNSLPEDSLINQYANQVSDRVGSAKENWRGYAQQVVSKAKDTGSSALHSGQDMAQKAKQTSMDVASKARQSGQDMAQKAKQSSQNATNKIKQSANFSGTSHNGASTRVFPETEE